MARDICIVCNNVSSFKNQSAKISLIARANFGLYEHSAQTAEKKFRNLFFDSTKGTVLRASNIEKAILGFHL